MPDAIPNPGYSTAPAPRTLSRLGAIVRAGEWWEYKLVPILGLFYATAILIGAPVASLWPAALTLLLALAPGAAWVSLINDIADRSEDAAAGKPNRMAGRPTGFMAAAAGLPLLAGLAFAWLWRGDGLLLGCYLAAWASFALYSIPPFRLKTRGLAGLLADAAGSNLFPGLVAILLAFRAAGVSPDPYWLCAAGAWALAYGIRGILWHQLLDLDNDRAAGVRTFAQRHPDGRAAALGKYLVFPAELAALAILLVMLREPAAAAALALHAWLTWLRLDRFRMQASAVEPGPRHMILLQEYYDLFLPLALLIASAVQFPIDLLAIAAHLLLFPRRAIHVARDCWKLRAMRLHRRREARASGG
ncbi:MAG TPA: UbiA family prenyltransferase [Allosphingosinicella sp.]